MANNCLVTKLKSTINNENLPVFGKMKVLINQTDSQWRGILLAPDYSNYTCQIKGGTINGSNIITSTSDCYLTINNTATIVSDGTYGEGLVQIIIPKYNLRTIQVSEVDAKDLLSSKDTLSILGGQGMTTYKNAHYIGDILGNPELREVNLRIYDCILDEDIDLSNLGLGGNIQTFGFDQTTKCKGTLDNLGFSASYLLNNGYIFPDSRNVSFSVENFVRNARTSGVTESEGTVNFYWLGAVNATFNGGTIENKENNRISWTSTTITFDDVTIEA